MNARAFPLEFLNGLANALSDVQKSLVTIWPRGDRFRIGGQRLEAFKWDALPVGGTQDDGNDPRLSYLLPLHGSSGLDTGAEGCGNEIRTDEQQDQVGRVQMGIAL